MRAKAQELQKRESKNIQLEEELKHKIQEVSRQLASKEEEIIAIKKRFKEEKVGMQNEKKTLTDQLTQAKQLLDETEERYREYRKDMEESPLSALRTEIGNKNIEIAELKTKLQKSKEDKEDLDSKFKKLRQEHTRIRREMERQKDDAMQRQAEELEKVKMELKSKAFAEQERQELIMLREELTRLQTQLIIQEDQSQRPNQLYMTNSTNENYNTTNLIPAGKNSNPFATIQSTSKVSQNKNSPSKQQKPESKLEQLEQMREDMLDAGFYHKDDDIIIELDSQIQRLKKSGSPIKDARS